MSAHNELFNNGFLYQMKSLGLRFLSWVFYHVTLDEEILESIANHEGTFLDILRVLAPRYCRFEGVKNIEWGLLDSEKWKDLLEKAQREQEQACTCK